jgi:hypothetical protein
MLERPKLTLSGEDRNAFAILGRARRAAWRAGWPQERWDAYKEEAMSGDYDDLLRATMEWFETT